MDADEFALLHSQKMTAPEYLGDWQELDNGMENVPNVVCDVSQKSHYSKEVTSSIMAAVRIVQEEMDQPVFALHVAKRVNLSRSYFNHCFKNIVGHSFNGYLRRVRIERAKRFLVQTNESIQWVAEKTGYMDEKYFSRIFREQTGMPPSVYRKVEG